MGSKTGAARDEGWILTCPSHPFQRRGRPFAAHPPTIARSSLPGGRLHEAAKNSYLQPDLGDAQFIVSRILVLLDTLSSMLPLVLAQVLPSAVSKWNPSADVLPAGGAHCRALSNTYPVKERVFSIGTINTSYIDSTWLT